MFSPSIRCECLLWAIDGVSSRVLCTEKCWDLGALVFSHLSVSSLLMQSQLKVRSERDTTSVCLVERELLSVLC